jgi:dipeptidyl aminopeptidase/acylaminoacyl peptidase
MMTLLLPLLHPQPRDLIHLLDILEARPDVDAARIGMGGISLGGMLTWWVPATAARARAGAAVDPYQKWSAARSARLGYFDLRQCSCDKDTLYTLDSSSRG